MAPRSPVSSESGLGAGASRTPPAESKEEGGRLLNVAVPLPLFQTFTYRVPSRLGDPPSPGARVLVPFGKRRLAAVATGTPETAPGELREIIEILDQRPLIPPRLLELGLWVGDYYHAPPGEALRLLFPPGLLGGERTRNRSGGRSHWPAKSITMIVEANPGEVEGSRRQQKLLELLVQQVLPVPLHDFASRVGCSPETLKRMAASGWLKVKPVEVSRSPWTEAVEGESRPHRLTSDQIRVTGRIAEALADPQFRVLLIHGVTGSGKTEVYLDAISNSLARGRSALVLVPEIGLTPQTSKLFRARFQDDRVAILHSGLSDGERFDQWRRIQCGTAQVVVGTRSAVFAPLPDLGLIIVDEEHDSSYKQEELPRYNGRDVALRRGQLEGALVVLGSATPQMETYYLASRSGRFQLERMPSRILARPLPEVRVVDMREEYLRHGKASPVSRPLDEAIRRRLDCGQQTLILLNRRGYSPIVLCRSCGTMEACRDCSITLTLHRRLGRLICHYCGFSRDIPKGCRECGKEYIQFAGEGTEQIEELLRGLYTAARVDRMDRDTVQRKGSAERILRRFAQGETDILIGTQMIAKGHDFPGVTLVGVLSADQGLRLPDFRAAERTFQLLTQVAGRAGRGEWPGEVFLQTYFPNHYGIRSACSQDYEQFFEQELRFRRDFHYPPWSSLASVTVANRNLSTARGLSEQLGQRLREARRRLSSPERLRVLGPAPAPIERIRGDYRFQILLKTTDRPEMHQVLNALVAQLDGTTLRSVTLDIDPVNLL